MGWGETRGSDGIRLGLSLEVFHTLTVGEMACSVCVCVRACVVGVGWGRMTEGETYQIVCS